VDIDYKLSLGMKIDHQTPFLLGNLDIHERDSGQIDIKFKGLFRPTTAPAEFQFKPITDVPLINLTSYSR
jgi:hypothetical protein